MRLKESDKINIQEYIYRRDYRGITSCMTGHYEQVTGYTTAKKLLEDYFNKRNAGRTYKERLTVIISIEGNPNWCAIYRSDDRNNWHPCRDL